MVVWFGNYLPQVKRMSQTLKAFAKYSSIFVPCEGWWNHSFCVRMNNWTALKDSWGRMRIDEQIGLVFKTVFNDDGDHFVSCCREQDIAFTDVSSPWADPFVFPFPGISQWKLGLEDSENVCSDCRWCYCVNINHKCRHRWGCVSFYLLLLLLFPRHSPFLSPVFLTFPNFVPVHSIRLEYGCVVVDTCSVWSVSHCCLVMICRSSWCHRTRSSDRINEDKRWKGWPRFPKKTLVPISHPSPFLKNYFWNFPAMHRSGIFLWIWKDMDCMYVLSWFLVTL